MSIKIADASTGAFLVRPASFEDAIKRACRLEHHGLKGRVYVGKNGTRIRVTTIL